MGSEAFVDSSMPSLEWFHLGYREEDLSRDLSCDSSLILFSEMKRMQRRHDRKVSGVLDSLVLFFPGAFSSLFFFCCFSLDTMALFFCVLSWDLDLVKGGFLYTENQNLDILIDISPFLHRKLY